MGSSATKHEAPLLPPPPFSKEAHVVLQNGRVGTAEVLRRWNWGAGWRAGGCQFLMGDCDYLALILRTQEGLWGTSDMTAGSDF